MPKTAVLFVITSFFFLFGCNEKDEKNEPDVVVWRPNVYIEYVNRGGIPFIKDTDSENTFAKKYPIEDLLVTEENGVINKYIYDDLSCMLIIIDGIFNLHMDKTIRQYTITYKIPTLTGESVEKIELSYTIDKMYSKFTSVWYNNSEVLRFVSNEMIFSSIPDPLDEEMVKQRRKELLYNGEMVVHIDETGDIHLIIPIDK